MRARSLVPLLIAASCAFAPGADAQVLFWLDTNFGAPTLNRTDPDGFGLVSVSLAPGTLPEGLAVAANGRLFWTEAAWSNARIQRVAPTLVGAVPIVTGGSVFRGVAVDDAGQLLYWTSSNLIAGAAVHRSGLDGGGATTLIPLGAGANPRGIAVNPAGGRLYWADFDQDAIWRANLDGTGAAVWIALPSQSHPYGVAFDPVGLQVYWTEFAGKLRRAPAAGGPITTLLGSLADPTYLALDPAGGRLYWAEGGAGAQRLQRSDLNGIGVVTLPPALTTYGGLAYQPDGSVAVPPPDGIPAAFALDPPSPNPASGPAHVTFALPRESRVRLSVLDLQGRERVVLADGVLPAGRHRTVWGADPERPVPAGVYFLRMTADGRAWVRRVVRIH